MDRKSPSPQLPITTEVAHTPPPVSRSHLGAYIDMHCHPGQKAFSRSLVWKDGRFHWMFNSAKGQVKHSVWHHDRPSRWDQIWNRISGLISFTQSDFDALSKGGVRIAIASLYPLEKNFLEHKGRFARVFLNFFFHMGSARIRFVQQHRDYFADLERIYGYYTKLHGESINLSNGKSARYVLSRSMQEIQQALPTESAAETVFVILSIEGGHVFNCGIDPDHRPAQPYEVLKRVALLKQWAHVPFFLTLGHHFYNELCGHAPSLEKTTQRFLNQTPGMEKGLTELGKQVIAALLSTRNGKRVYIDIKHMGVRARIEYYQLLAEKYVEDDVPIIVSHGAVNGWKSLKARWVQIPGSYGLFRGEEINFSDEELVLIAKSNGIFGIQPDERRIAPVAIFKDFRWVWKRKKLLKIAAELLWEQVRHIAEVLDRNGLFAWGIQAIGTDFDGFMDPINGLWTAKDIPALEPYLLDLVSAYLSDNACPLVKEENTLIASEEIVHRVMRGNAFNLLKRYY